MINTSHRGGDSNMISAPSIKSHISISAPSPFISPGGGVVDSDEEKSSGSLAEGLRSPTARDGMSRPSQSRQAREGGADNQHERHDTEPYSIYTRRERWCIVLMVSFAGLYRYVSDLFPLSTGPAAEFNVVDVGCVVADNDSVCSTLPSVIYFPAVPLMGISFGVSRESINQTVTGMLMLRQDCRGISR